MHLLAWVVLLGAASATVSVTVTRTFMFRWWRELFDEEGWHGHLFRCHYCLGHWVSVALVWVFKEPLIDALLLMVGPVYWRALAAVVVVWLAVTAVSGWIGNHVLPRREPPSDEELDQKIEAKLVSTIQQMTGKAR